MKVNELMPPKAEGPEKRRGRSLGVQLRTLLQPQELDASNLQGQAGHRLRMGEGTVPGPRQLSSNRRTSPAPRSSQLTVNHGSSDKIAPTQGERQLLSVVA